MESIAHKGIELEFLKRGSINKQLSFPQSWANVRKNYTAKKHLMSKFIKKNDGFLEFEIIFYLPWFRMYKIFSLKNCGTIS